MGEEMYHILSLSLLLRFVTVQNVAADPSGSCVVGDDLSSTSPSRRGGLFLNTDSPSNYSGVAVGWNACYTPSYSDTISRTLFGVYRPTSSGNSSIAYELVADSATNATNITVTSAGSPLDCLRFPIPRERQFTVQPGDVVGACVRYLGDGRLGIVADDIVSSKSYLSAQRYICRGILPQAVGRATGAYLLSVVAVRLNLEVISATQCGEASANMPTISSVLSVPTGESSTGLGSIVIGILGAAVAIMITALLPIAIAIAICRRGRRRDLARPSTSAISWQSQLMSSTHLYDTRVPTVPQDVAASTDDTGTLEITKNVAYPRSSIIVMSKNEVYGLNLSST